MPGVPSHDCGVFQGISDSASGSIVPHPEEKKTVAARDNINHRMFLVFRDISTPDY